MFSCLLLFVVYYCLLSFSVDIVKFEVSSDNGDDPVIIRETSPNGSTAVSAVTKNIPTNELSTQFNVHSTHANTTPESTTTIKSVPPNSGLTTVNINHTLSLPL